jgi:hypothetical protein
MTRFTNNGANSIEPDVVIIVMLDFEGGETRLRVIG